MKVNKRYLKEKTIIVHVCQKCGHEWQPRNPKNIRMCPKCKTTYWDAPKKEKVV